MASRRKKKAKKPLVNIPNSFLKNPDHKETSLFFLNGMQARHEQKMSKYLVLMQEATRKDNHPVAYIFLAANYLREDDKENVKKALLDGLICGLTTQQFYNKDVVISLCGFMQGLITGPYQKYRKELLTMIKNELKKNDISLTIFYEIFQELTTIKLSSVPEWNG
jgi:hypothetical protein